MCEVVQALTKGYPLFQIVEQEVSFFRKPKRLQTEKEARILTCNNCMCKIIQKCELGGLLGACAQ